MVLAGDLAAPGRPFAFDGAVVTGATFDGANQHAAFALGDGSVRVVALDGGEPLAIAAHSGAVLALATGIDGGLLSGGDDGRLCRLGSDGTVEVLASFGGAWVEHIAASAVDGTVVCSAGRDAAVIAVGGRRLPEPRRLSHLKTVGGLALDARGRRLAVSHYGGVTLWWTRSAEQTPVRLPWTGSHLACAFSPNAQFVVTTMQENSLHGWRVADKADMRMTGYPHKVRSMTWLPRGRLLATGGAERIVCWPFEGRNGPMGKSAFEVGPEDAGAAVMVAAHPGKDLIASGHADGGIWLSRLQDDRAVRLRHGTGAPATALAWRADGSFLAAGAEDGSAALFDFRDSPTPR